MDPIEGNPTQESTAAVVDPTSETQISDPTLVQAPEARSIRPIDRSKEPALQRGPVTYDTRTVPDQGKVIGPPQGEDEPVVRASAWNRSIGGAPSLGTPNAAEISRQFNAAQHREKVTQAVQGTGINIEPPPLPITPLTNNSEGLPPDSDVAASVTEGLEPPAEVEPAGGTGGGFISGIKNLFRR